MPPQLISDKFQFREFIDFIKDKDWHGMHDAVQRECAAVARLTAPGRRGAPEARAAGSSQYERQLKQLAYFLGQFVHPLGVSPSDFRLYLPLVTRLNELGQLQEPQRVLALFE